MAAVGNQTEHPLQSQQLTTELKSIPATAQTTQCAEMIQPVMHGFMASLLSLIALLVIIGVMNNHWNWRALGGEQRQGQT